jgi:hypothetical protein
MNKKMKDLVKILILTIISLSAFSACDKDDDKDTTYYYTIGIDQMSVSGSLSYLSVLNAAEQKYESSFNLTGAKKVCDAQAKMKFDAAMVIVKTAAATVTDCSGTITYILQNTEETIASEVITFQSTD